MKTLKLCGAVILALSTAAMSGQTTTPNANLDHHRRDIHQRKQNQQERIGNGVKSGRLTARESSNLERRESSINREEHAMRKADNGRLTKADRKALHARQNRVSRSIYRDKHNDRRR